MKDITLWYRWILDDKKVGRWDFNHIDDGYDATVTHPRSKVEEHDKAWKGGKWVGMPGQLNAGVIINAQLP